MTNLVGSNLAARCAPQGNAPGIGGIKYGDLNQFKPIRSAFQLLDADETIRATQLVKHPCHLRRDGRKTDRLLIRPGSKPSLRPDAPRAGTAARPQKYHKPKQKCPLALRRILASRKHSRSGTRPPSPPKHRNPGEHRSGVPQAPHVVRRGSCENGGRLNHVLTLYRRDKRRSKR